MALLFLFAFALGFISASAEQHAEGAAPAPADVDRNLQYGSWPTAPKGRKMGNNCAEVFKGNPVMNNGLQCRAPCNNPCNMAPVRFPNGCGAGSYCSCAYNTKLGGAPLMSCSYCPYTRAGTQCPGDGFYYDATYPAPAPLPAAAPRRTAPPVAKQCDGQDFGTCAVGQYCRQKSTDWTYVCTAPCPTNMVCPGDGKRYPKVPNVPGRPPIRQFAGHLRGAWDSVVSFLTVASEAETLHGADAADTASA